MRNSDAPMDRCHYAFFEMFSVIKTFDLCPKGFFEFRTKHKIDHFHVFVFLNHKFIHFTYMLTNQFVSHFWRTILHSCRVSIWSALQTKAQKRKQRTLKDPPNMKEGDWATKKRVEFPKTRGKFQVINAKSDFFDSMLYFFEDEAS